jgi:hypothetical protein
MNSDQSSSSITIYGDSNLHKWDIKATKFNGTGSFVLDGGKLKTISSFSLTLETKEIKSDSDSMNEKTAKALEPDKYPQIVCTIKSSYVSGDTVTGSMEYNLHGVKKTIDFSSKITNSKDSLVVEGEQDLVMTDFGITPPKTQILFVTTTAKPELKIKYKLTLKAK